MSISGQTLTAIHAPGRAVGSPRLAEGRKLPLKALACLGGKPRPRRVGFGAAVKAFRHISDRVSGLQSQILNGAARALRGLPAALLSAGEGLSFDYQGIARRHS